MLFTKSNELGFSPIRDENIHDKKINKTESFEYASGSVEFSWNYYENINFEKRSCNGNDQ